MENSDNKKPVSPKVFSLLRRYLDAYRLARSTRFMGKAVKVAGVIIGVLIAGMALLILQATGGGEAFALLIPSLITGIIIGGVIYVIGVLVTAQGQTMLVSLDQAVYSSTFFTNEHRAKVMSLSGGDGVTFYREEADSGRDKPKSS